MQHGMQTSRTYKQGCFGLGRKQLALNALQRGRLRVHPIRSVFFKDANVCLHP